MGIKLSGVFHCSVGISNVLTFSMHMLQIRIHFCQTLPIRTPTTGPESPLGNCVPFLQFRTNLNTEMRYRNAMFTGKPEQKRRNVKSGSVNRKYYII